MRNLFLAAMAVSALPLTAPALAQTSVSQTIKCPIGGASFRFTTAAAAPVQGERPDGKPYSATSFPLPLPECPDNGLVLYKEYDEAEVAKLEPLIASEAYRALLKDDVPYYRAYWLMREMGVGADRYLWALLQAAWQADGKPDLRQRYLAELAEASAKVEARPSDLNWIGMEGRAINALRELGRFDEASARLAKVPLSTLEKTPAGEAAARTRVRRGWLAFFGSLKAAIARKDAAVEPLDLLPRSLALGRCAANGASLDEPGRAFCEKEAAAVEAFRASRDKAAAELEALRKSREQSGR
jgi:hypothetical protein